MSVDVAELVLRVESLEVKQAARELDKFRKTGAKAEKEMSYLETRSKSLSGQFSKMKALFASGIFALGVKGAISMVDGYKNVNALLNIVTSSNKEFLQTQKELFDIAQNNYSTIGDTTKLYAGQAKQLETLGYAHGQQIDAVDLFNKALATSGATTVEASSATLQWVQALGSGVLRGQEFNSIMENGRGVAIALADGLNTTIGNLRNMALEGKLSAKIVVDALLSQEEEIRSKFAKIPITVAKAWTQLTNSSTLALSKINDRIGDASGAVAGMISSLSSMIDNMNFDVVITGLTTVATLITAYIVPAILKAGVAMAIAFATNPVLLIVTAITSAAMALSYYKDETITVGNNTATVGDFVGATWDYIKEKTLTAYTSMKQAASDLFQRSKESWNNYMETLEDGSAWKTVMGYMSQIPEAMKSYANFTIGVWVGMINSIIAGYKILPEAIGDLTVQSLNGMINIFEKGINTIILGAYNIPYALATAFDNMIIGMKKIPGAFGEIFRAAMANAKKWVLSGVDNVIGWLNKILPDSKQISKVVGEVGDTTIASINMIAESVKNREAIQAEDVFQVDFSNIENKYSGKAAELGGIIREEFSGALDVDYIAATVDIFNGEIDKIGESAENRHFMREFKDDIESLGGNMGNSSIKIEEFTNKAKKLAPVIKKNKKASDKLKKAQDMLKASQKALAEGFNSEILALDIRALKVKGNEDAIVRLRLANETFGQNNLKYSKEQINEIANRTKNIVLLEKEKEAREKVTSSYKKELKALKERNFALLNTASEAYGQTLKDQKITGNRYDELVGINSENNALETFGQLDAEEIRFQEELLRLETAEQMKLDTILPYKELREMLELEHQNKLTEIAQNASDRRNKAEIDSFRLATKPYREFTGGVLDILKASGEEQSGLYKAMFAASKAFAIAESVIKIQQGIAQAASLPFPANLGAIGGVISATSGIISTIKGTEYAGAFANGGEFMVAGQGGIDNNRISMDVSRGEQVVIKTPKQQKEPSSNPTVINIRPEPGVFIEERKTSENEIELIASRVGASEFGKNAENEFSGSNSKGSKAISNNWKVSRAL